MLSLDINFMFHLYNTNNLLRIVMPKQIEAVMLMHQINTDYLTVCFIIKCKMLKFTILHNGI